MSTAMSKSPTMSPKRVPEREKFIDKCGAFGAEKALPPAVRDAESAPEEVLCFSEFSDPETIRDICYKNVPGWSALKHEDIIVDQLLEGLSNQLFKCHVEESAMKKQTGVVPCVLFRIYGKDVSSLYDSEVEFKVFQTLASYQIAPRMFAHGDGWRIEEWHFSVPLPTSKMRNPSIFSQVASQIGRFHKLSARHDFPREILSQEAASIQRIRSWSDNAEKASVSLTDNESTRRLKDMGLEEVIEEREWLASFILADDPKVRGAGLDRVFSHNDVQENNILQTHYGLRFIDFEYSSMDYQAYDIANYFCECTLDYCFTRYPFYKQNLADYPMDWERRLFCAIYLSEYLETSVRPEDVAVDALLERVERFALVSHYLWAVWSVIRARQAPTFNEFDFLHYAGARWDTYKREKRRILAKEALMTRVASEYFRKPGAKMVPSDSIFPKTPMVMASALTLTGVLTGGVFAMIVYRLSRR